MKWTPWLLVVGGLSLEAAARPIARTIAGSVPGSTLVERSHGSKAKASQIVLPIGDKPYGLFVVEPTAGAPKRVLHYFSGSNVSPEATIGVPFGDASLASFLAGKGWLVIGHGATENFWIGEVPASAAQQGLPQSLEDGGKAIQLIKEAVSRDDYELGGFSAGGLEALLFSAEAKKKNRPGKHWIIDPNPIYEPGSREAILGSKSLETHKRSFANERYAVHRFGPSLKQAFAHVKIDPSGDSQVSRRSLGANADGTFTHLGLAGYLWTGQRPWYLKGPFLAGTYHLEDDPKRDTFSFDHTELSTIAQAVSARGSDRYPTKKRIDMLEVMLGIDRKQRARKLGKVDGPIALLSAGLGFGPQKKLLEILPHTKTQLVPGWGHSDLLYARAGSDLWRRWFFGP